MRTCSVEIMAQEGTRDYLAIAKGRGFVYAYENQLYNRVKTEGRTKYLKCCKVGCDGSAKIIGDLFFLGVRTFLCYYIIIIVPHFPVICYRPGDVLFHLPVIYI